MITLVIFLIQRFNKQINTIYYKKSNPFAPMFHIQINHVTIPYLSSKHEMLTLGWFKGGLGSTMLLNIKPTLGKRLVLAGYIVANEMSGASGHLQAKLDQENLLKMVRWHCTPDTGFEIQTLEVWGRTRYLSVTEAPHNTEFYEWMWKKHETGKRTPKSSVKRSGANHYPRSLALTSWQTRSCWLRYNYQITKQ